MVKYTLGEVIKLAENIVKESKKVKVILKRQGKPKTRAEFAVEKFGPGIIVQVGRFRKKAMLKKAAKRKVKKAPAVAPAPAPAPPPPPTA